MKKIKIIGDSLTYGLKPFGQGIINKNENWPNILLQKLNNFYKQDLTLLIDSYPGRTIYPYKEDLGFLKTNGIDIVSSSDFYNEDFNTCIIFLGTNDFIVEESLNKIKNIFCKKEEIYNKILIGLEKLINIIKSKTQDIDFIIICPPIVNTLMEKKFLGFHEYVVKNISIKDIKLIGLENKCDPSKEDFINYDGLHYTQKKCDVLANVIYNEFIS
ncbi:hypothetical protein NPX79_00460 [Spiroplasma endosymbiont of Anurida maritima]|uniref:hypothetical protein n=1 Tax=Spiroplasma endosymbiont of Anurida maritima TaxID=2967972 RepID=UPI0036D29A4E